MRMLAGAVLALCFAAHDCPAQFAVDPVAFPLVKNVFDPGADEKPFECEVHPFRPTLTFAFQFQSGWRIEIPTHNIRRDKHRFIVLARVIPEHAGARPLYLYGDTILPEAAGRKNEWVDLYGAFLMGPGSYTIDLAAFDDEHSVCRSTSRVQAELKRSQQDVVLALQPWELRALEPGVWTRFAASGAADRPRSGRLTVLLNAAPFRHRAARVNGPEFGMMISSIAALLRFTSFEAVRMVAYNLDQQKVIYRQDNFRPESIGELARAVHEVNLATVPIDVVNRPTGYLDLLKDVLEAEAVRSVPSSIVLFFGPTVPYDRRNWNDGPAVNAELVYVNFRPFWGAWNPMGPGIRAMRDTEFPDLIERITKRNSGKVFRIHSPEEFARALAHVSRPRSKKP